jgi:hypothetical protein
MRRGFLAGAIAALTLAAMGGVRGNDAPAASWVDAQVRAFRTAPAMGWTQIPWVGSLVEARRIGREEGRPVFLFTHDGNIASGRC